MLETFTKIKEKKADISVKEIAKSMLERFHLMIGKSSKKDILNEEISKIVDFEKREETINKEDRFIFPDNVEDIKITEYLGGSSEVNAGYVNGEYFVVKKARRDYLQEPTKDEVLIKNQIIEEYMADQIYKLMGFNVPVSKIYENGKYKVSKFIKGKNLDTFSGEELEYENIKKELQKGFVLDCLLANWDVIGTSGISGGDNIRIGDDGKLYRIDNGGALRFRAKGGKKSDFDFNSKVEELDSLKNKNELFSDISDEEIENQINKILEKRDDIFDVVNKVVDFLDSPESEKLKLILIIKKRIDYLESFLEDKRKKIAKGNYESIATNNYFNNWDEVELVGNSGIKEKIKENILLAEERNKNIYEDAAKDLGLSVEEFKEKLQKRVEDVIEKSNFFRATRVDILDMVMNVDGRYKSQFETGTSEGLLNPTRRTNVEKLMFGFDDEDIEKNKEIRPIYGYFSDEINGAINFKGKIPPPNNVNQYGCVNVKIKKEKALQKATITFEDSLTVENNWPPTPAKKPHFSSFCTRYTGSTLFEEFKATSVTNYGSNYNEAQYHGQLTIDDVESIHISLENGLSKEDIEIVRNTFKKYKEMYPESTLKLIEF